jgi:hypothetical protein
MRRFLFFVHLFDLHEPYSQLPAVARRRGISRYDAQLEYADQVVGRFRQALVKDGWWDRSLAVLVSDHGEGLGEHCESNHGYFIYQSTLWVPLMFHWPADSSGYPARISQPAGLIDVAPTILDFLHLAVAPSFEGESLLRRSRTGGHKGSHTVFSESVYTHDAFGWAPLRSMRAGAYKYIEAPEPELYNLRQDPHEWTNLVRNDPAVASELRGRLRSLLSRYPAKHPAPVQDRSPGAQALLRSLGYLSAGRSERADSEPDPKERLPELRLYEKALTYLSERRIREAIVTLQQIVAQNPHNTVARRDLGDCYLESKSYARARTNLEKVVAAAPDDYMAQLELGIADEHLGLLDEAQQHMQAACQLYPDSAECRRELETVERKRLAAAAGPPRRP